MLRRDETRKRLQVYMSVTGMGLIDIAARTGYSRHSIRQFASGATYGTSNGDVMSEALDRFMDEHPPERPEVPGRLYETEVTRQIAKMVAHGRRGGWGTLYGPAGGGKTYTLEYLAASAAAEAEPSMILVDADPLLTPRALLARIGMKIAAPYAQYTEGMRQSIIYAVRSRRHPLALVIDEAQLLYRRVDTLETLRRLGDRLRGRLGIIVAGNEQVENLFEPRNKVKSYFEQWRSRVEQKRVRVLGPTQEDARKMIAGELGQVPEAAVKWLIDDCTVLDAGVTKKRYISARRLFDSLAAYDPKTKAN